MLLTHLAWNVITKSRKAGSEYTELNQQVSALHVFLKRLERDFGSGVCTEWREASNTEVDHFWKNEIQDIMNGCGTVLHTLNNIIERYESLDETRQDSKRTALLQKVRFSNREVAELKVLREKLTYYTSLLTVLLNTRSSSLIDRVERRVIDTDGILYTILAAVNRIAARDIGREGNEASSNTHDSTETWIEPKREAFDKFGYQVSDIQSHSDTTVTCKTETNLRETHNDCATHASSG